MTLRTRLIAAMSVIALTLVAAMVFVTRSTEANLTAQVDDDLAGASRAAEAIAYGLGDPPPVPSGDRPEPRPDDEGSRLSAVYVGVVDGEEVVTVERPGLNEESSGLPQIDAAEASGEPFWHLPIPEEISENLTSDVADLASSGKNRYGGALTAAAFLREFVGDERSWAHLDIAGPAWNGKGAYDYTPKAGTGFAVRTLVALARDLAG